MCDKTHYWKLANKHRANAEKSIKKSIVIENQLGGNYHRHTGPADFLEKTERRIKSYEKIAYAKRQSDHAERKYQRILDDCENIYSVDNTSALRSNIRKANQGIEIASAQYQEASSIEKKVKERITRTLQNSKITDLQYLESYQLLIDTEYLSLGKIYSQGQRNVYTRKLKQQNNTGDYNNLIQFIYDHTND